MLAVFASLMAAAPDPGTEGPRQAALREAAAYSTTRGGVSLLVSHRGRLVFAAGAPEQLHRPVPVLSITKGLVGLAAVMAQTRGLLRLDEPAAATLSGWKGSSATLEDLLNFSAGLDAGAGVFYRRGATHNRGAVLATRPSRNRGFVYGPASYEVFGEIFRLKLEGRGLDPLGFLQQQLLSRCRASADNWRRDSSGAPFFSTGASLSPRQMLCLGEELLRSGNPFLGSSHPSRAFAAIRRGAAALPAYQLGFWRNLARDLPDAKEMDIEAAIRDLDRLDAWRKMCISRAAPPDLVAMAGSGGQRIYLLPSRQLVVVRTGVARSGFRDPEFLALLLR